MTIQVSPTESQIMATLRSFLTAVVPSGVPVVIGQANRVPEPKSANFVVMWPLRRPRLSTNFDEDLDTTFTASISGTLLTVDTIATGTIIPGMTVYGSGVAVGTQIESISSPGLYVVSVSQNLSLRAMASGVHAVTQHTQIDVQIDVHGQLAGDNAQKISTLLRDPWGVDKFAESGFEIVPLYANDPRQMPFVNAEKQYEDRWIVEASLQANQTIAGLPQQFADTLEVDLINVDANYPA